MTSPSTFDTFFSAVHPEHISFSGWTVLLGLVTTFHFASRTVFRKRNTNPSHLEQPRVSQKCFHLFHNKKYSEKTHSKEFINLFLFSSTEGILSYFSSPPSYINYPSFYKYIILFSEELFSFSLLVCITPSLQEPPDWNGLVDCGGLVQPAVSLARSESSPPTTQVTEPCDEV